MLAIHNTISPLLDDQDGVRMSLEEWTGDFRFLVFGEIVCFALQLFSPFNAEISAFDEDNEIQVNSEDSNGDDICLMISEDGIILSSSLARYQHFPWTSELILPNVEETGNRLINIGMELIRVGKKVIL